MNQIILHVDMDAFYASVEIQNDPSLRGKPLIIGSLPSERGVVATCSYEARKFGVHSGVNIKDAHRLCPQGIYRHRTLTSIHRSRGNCGKSGTAMPRTSRQLPWMKRM